MEATLHHSLHTIMYTARCVLYVKCVSHMWCMRVENSVPRVSVPYTPQSLTSFEAIHVAMVLGTIAEWVGQEEVDNFWFGMKSNFG